VGPAPSGAQGPGSTSSRSSAQLQIDRGGGWVAKLSSLVAVLFLAAARWPLAACRLLLLAGGMALRRYTAPWIDFGRSPISTVTVDELTGTVTLSGLVCDDVVSCAGRPSSAEEAKGNPAAEAKLVLGAVADLLAAVGTPMSFMVNCLVHVSDIEAFAGINEAFAEYYAPGTGPTRTTVEASAIIFGCAVEISATARRPADAPPLPPDGPLAVGGATL
jgi:enamine deaminase RidA (YjgF/YER057c/UK114 family)